jgi:hypothetical protein
MSIELIDQQNSIGKSNEKERIARNKPLDNIK